ncbi:MAG: hypothetical protein HKN47_20550, partial [Pirellulaceae bacterium]|nr:hypothetical protein [Pirellulaceae bacterium]
VFNSGHHAQCAAIYMSALQAVAATENHGLSDVTVKRVHQTMQRAQTMHSMSDRAWTLRHEMDNLLQQL